MSANEIADMFEAAASGDLNYIKQHIRLINEKNERGWTPLHFAARFGHLEVAQFLKENKADLTIVNNEGKTAGQLAEFWGNDALAKLLTIEKPQAQNIAAQSPFPENYTPLFGGNPLNRFGWNRAKPEFLSKLARSPKTNYIVLNNLQALYHKNGKLHFVKYQDVSSVVDRVFTQDNQIEENITDVILVFMGIDERQGKGEDGEAYWALDLTPKGVNEKQYSELIAGFESKEFEFVSTLPRAFVMDRADSALISQAVSMVDWNARHVYCAACGKKTISLEAGYKRNCPVDKNSKVQCISHSTIQNYSYPRTDAVVITCIIHPDGNQILLGRQKRFPKRMYSCLSGFVEAGETLEEAVRREILEEVGVHIEKVAYHSSQPWPFPNSLMLGFFGKASTTEIVFSDDELESARWFSREEVLAASKNEKGSTFFMPAKGALATTLIHSWLYDQKWQINNPKL